jgi:hypothetical protein
MFVPCRFALVVSIVCFPGGSRAEYDKLYVLAASFHVHGV